MADGTAKQVIFISYSHKDRAELEYVRAHLGPVVGLGTVTVWDDNALQIGDDWKGDINSAIDACRVFILLVTCHSLGSKFIRDVEVPRVLPRWQAKQVQFCPILVKPCHLDGYWWLDAINRRPKDGKALSELPDASRDREMAEIVGEIVKFLNSGAVIDTPLVPAAKTSSPTIIDYTRLPETPYRRLVGRDAEMAALDEGWIDRLTNIISLVAEGGAGKSALVNEWLKQLQADNYRGAEAVLGWSFYSQGSKERATSAEEFLNWALHKLGIAATTTSASASAKGEAIAEALAMRRVLLLLDGVEPLQHGLDKQRGELKDAGLRALLRRFASTPPGQSHGLIALTSRIAVKDIARWQDNVAPVIDIEKLSDDAGAALLCDNGVRGTDKELKTAAHDFGGHALALGLLASFLTETQTGDVRRRDRIRGLLADVDNPGHDHAERVMESYEKEWLAGRPVLLAIMHMVGLFDRPASGDCLNALRAKPVIEGLTDEIVSLDDSEWQRAVTRLCEVRLILPRDPTAPDALDAHPLVREWFGERLKATNEPGWKAAQGRLFEHLRDTTKEGNTPTLEDLAPLYQAIAHGCRAGHHEEALDKIYKDRICRHRPDGDLEFYSRTKLGAIGSDLAALSWFFDKPYATPVAALTPSDQSWVLSVAALRLRAQGRFTEALPADRTGLRLDEDAQDWRNAGITASCVSEAELLVGEITAAVGTAERSVAYADRSGYEYEMMSKRTTYANALHAAGRREEAAEVFADAERRQKEVQPAYPLLYSLWGYRYCDLLLAKGEYIAARDQATQTLKWARHHGFLLDIAHDTLALGRAHLGLGLALAGTHQMSAAMRGDARAAGARFDEAVDGLRAAGDTQFVGAGLLARIAFHRSVGDWESAARDLDEVEEIAEPSTMKLHLCDLALERARLAFAKIEVFAPLNSMLEKENPPKPEVPNTEEIAALKSEAEKQLKIAANYIEQCGYHRRDKELTELQAVLRGERKFADLPPRV
jgi:tetratricopeptide (TPR) repeat protein